MYYIKKTFLLVTFIALLCSLFSIIDKREMEVSYEDKENFMMPVISICTSYDDLVTNCQYETDEIDEDGGDSIDENDKKATHNYHGFEEFMNKTTSELLEFERRCRFLDVDYLAYIHNNTYIHASNVTSYLNFGMFCRLYEFNQIIKNYNDSFFKINSTHNKSLTVFMHEPSTYPSDVNLKIYSSEFKGNKEAILILVEFNKMIKSRGHLFVSEAEMEFNNTEDCIQDCFKRSNIAKFNFRYLQNELDYTIQEYQEKKGYELIKQRCKKKCDYGHFISSYFKLEKITYNCDLITASFNKTMSLQPWILFYQNNRVVTFNLNNVITFKVLLIILCNIVSLIFGFSFFSLITNLVHSLRSYIKFKFAETNFQCAMIIVSIFLSFLQSREIIEEYFKYQTTTDLVMNMRQTIPNITVSLCFNDLLVNFAPNYDGKRNEFSSNDKLNKAQTSFSRVNNNSSLHLKDQSVQDLINFIDGIELSKQFSLEIQISNKKKYVNTLKESTKLFMRNGRYCYRIDLQLSNFVTKNKNRIKALIESEAYLYMRLKKNFEFFFLTSYQTFPSFENSAYKYENTFRIQQETFPDSSDQLNCLNYAKHKGCRSQSICVERCLISKYYRTYNRLPIDITYVPDDPYWQNVLNMSNDLIFFDTNPQTYNLMKAIKEECMRHYHHMDCTKAVFQSVNIRQKGVNSIKISLYFDRVNIKHLNKMDSITLANYLVSILSLWIGFSYRIVEKNARKLLAFLNKRQADAFLYLFLVVGLIAHVYYICISMIENNLTNITYFQPSKFILQPLFSLCWSLSDIYIDFDHNLNEEITGHYLTEHTKNLSQLIRSIKFLNNEFEYVELNSTHFKNFEGKIDHFIEQNMEIQCFYYYKYKCYEFKHLFKDQNIWTLFNYKGIIQRRSKVNEFLNSTI